MFYLIKDIIDSESTKSSNCSKAGKTKKNELQNGLQNDQNEVQNDQNGLQNDQNEVQNDQNGLQNDQNGLQNDQNGLQNQRKITDKTVLNQSKNTNSERERESREKERTKEKETKELESINNPPIVPPRGSQYESEFAELWKLYPRREGKQGALRAYIKARKEGVSAGEVRAGIEAYRDKVARDKTERQYVKMGSTFFNQRSWEDDYTAFANTKINSEQRKEYRAVEI